MINKFIAMIALSLGLNAGFAGGEIALTIDDLPFLGHAGKDAGKSRRQVDRFHKILDTLQQEQVPATGFVIAGAIEPGQWELLELWKNSGYPLGNHTYSHLVLNRTDTEKYINDVNKADQILKSLMTGQKYFRYPGLSMGRNIEQENAVKNFLVKNHYSIAPVSIETKDYVLNKQVLDIPWEKRKAILPSICHQYANRTWHLTEKAEQKAEKDLHRPIKQILLMHMNYLNAYCLRDIIQMYRNHGYKFISLQQATQDPYYAHRDEVTSFKAS